MTRGFAASVEAWSKKAQRNLDLVIRASIQDVGELMTRTQPSVKETGGAYKEGFVPVDTGELISSQEASINGVVVQSGIVDYGTAVASYTFEDSFMAVFRADHARPIEYGVAGKFGGRFYVRNAVQQWPAIVAANAERFKD